jgi:hypothetical protein
LQLVVYATFHIKGKNLHLKICTFTKTKFMGETITIEITNKKVRKLLESFEELKMLRIISKTQLNLSPKKKKQAKEFLQALKQAKLAEQGKIQLKTAQSLIDELRNPTN